MADRTDETTGTPGAAGSAGPGGVAGSGMSAGGTGSSGPGAGGTTGTTNRLAGEDLGSKLREAGERADEILDTAAERLQGAAQQLDELAERAPEDGVGARAGALAGSTADTLEAVAAFLRDNDVDTLSRSLGRIVSRHPVTTLAGFVAVGFVVGKTLR